MTFVSMLPVAGTALLTVASLLVIAPMLRPRKDHAGTGLRLVEPAANAEHSAPRTQLKIVPPVHTSEADRILPMLERIVAEIDDGHRILRQVAVGAILRAPNGRGGAAQQLDFVVIDRNGRVAALIDGAEHPAARSEALLRAGFDLIRPPADVDEPTLRSLLELRSRLPVRLSPAAELSTEQPAPRAARA